VGRALRPFRRSRCDAAFRTQRNPRCVAELRQYRSPRRTGPDPDVRARSAGFNFYAGSLRYASFAGIATEGDGAIAVQVGRPLEVLEIAGDLSTAGGRGRSLVKGVEVVLEAIALSVKPGGEVGRIAVGGQVRAAGDGVVSVEVEGAVGRIFTPFSRS